MTITIQGRNFGRTKAFVDNLAKENKNWKQVLKQIYPKLYDQFKFYKP